MSASRTRGSDERASSGDKLGRPKLEALLGLFRSLAHQIFDTITTWFGEQRLRVCWVFCPDSPHTNIFQTPLNSPTPDSTMDGESPVLERFLTVRQIMPYSRRLADGDIM